MNDIHCFLEHHAHRGAASIPACAFLVSLFLVAGNALGAAATGPVMPLNSLKTGWKLVRQLSDELDDVMLDIAKWDNNVPDWSVS
jgi:hypothetical protein